MITPFPRILAGGPISRQNCAGIHVWVDDGFKVYIVNTGESEFTLSPGELFGYNTGNFSEMVSSNARCSKDVLHFCIKSDSDTVVYEKAAVSVADLICDLAGERGVIDIQMQDHNLKPATEAWNSLLFQTGIFQSVMVINFHFSLNLFFTFQDSCATCRWTDLRERFGMKSFRKRKAWFSRRRSWVIPRMPCQSAAPCWGHASVKTLTSCRRQTLAERCGRPSGSSLIFPADTV